LNIFRKAHGGGLGIEGGAQICLHKKEGPTLKILEQSWLQSIRRRIWYNASLFTLTLCDKPYTINDVSELLYIHTPYLTFLSVLFGLEFMAALYNFCHDLAN